MGKLMSERRAKSNLPTLVTRQASIDSNSRALTRKKVGDAVHFDPFTRQVRVKIEARGVRLDQRLQQIGWNGILKLRTAPLDVLEQRPTTNAVEFRRLVMRPLMKPSGRVADVSHGYFRLFRNAL